MFGRNAGIGGCCCGCCEGDGAIVVARATVCCCCCCPELESLADVELRRCSDKDGSALEESPPLALGRLLSVDEASDAVLCACA